MRGRPLRPVQEGPARTVRYAIYLTPRRTDPLTEAAEVWLGRSAFSGDARPAAAPAAAQAATPARYGFHATMRAPFRLAEDVDEAGLRAAFEAFAARQGEIAVRLALGRLGGFLALVAADPAAVDAAHHAALDAFEPFRAPLSAAETARRRPEALDARGRDLLAAYGYPHVRERFGFHMTLTGDMPDDAAGPVEAAAARHFAPFIGPPQHLVFALFAERAAGGPFTILSSLPQGARS